jgi:hypothetical protein
MGGEKGRGMVVRKIDYWGECMGKQEWDWCWDWKLRNIKL